MKEEGEAVVKGKRREEKESEEGRRKEKEDGDN